MDVIVYKLRHKPTGLFYQPTKGRWRHNVSNLSKRGKIYETKQYPRNLHKGSTAVSVTLRKQFGLPLKQEGYSDYLITRESDWEVVKYKLKAIGWTKLEE